MDEATLAIGRSAATALFDIGFATMVGALATLALLRDTTSDWAVRGARRSRTLFVRANLLALAAGLAWMWLQAIALTELAPADALPAIGSIVVDTGFGRAWAVAALALAACLAIALATRYRPAPLRALGGATTLAAVAHACAGHAGANGFGWRVPATTVHLLAAGLWAGAVFAAVLAVPGDASNAIDGERYARRLSALATAALAGVVATGAASAWHGLGGSLAPLAPASGSTWGATLAVKLALVALALALGGYNRFAALPALPGSWRRFVAVLRIEAVVLLAVLAAAAWLGDGAPPAV